MNSWNFISAKITSLCTERNLTLQELARRSGLSRSTVHGIASGRQIPYLTTLKRICDGLEISLSDFFRADETALPRPQDGETLSNK